MKKMRVYFETSSVSNLEQPNMPEAMADMRALWEKLKQGEYEAVLSDTVFSELYDIKDENKLAILLNFLEQIEFDRILLSDEVDTLTEIIIEHGILPREKYRDCQHLACAMVSGCDCIVSYNFKDINRIKTITGIQRLAILHGYGLINIVDAAKLL